MLLTFTKIWTIICNLRNFFPFSKNMGYHVQFQNFLFLLQKHRLSYAISGISFSSSKWWTIIYRLRNFFLLSKNVDYHMQFLKFLSLLQKCGLSYTIFGISFS